MQEASCINLHKNFDFLNVSGGGLYSNQLNKILISRFLHGKDIVDMMCPDGNGHVSLHVAAKGGHVEIVEMMLDLGVDVESSDLEGRSPLLTGARFGSLEVLKLLVQRGAEMNRYVKSHRMERI